MKVDANNPADQDYRVIRADTGEVVPYVTAADTDTGEITVLRHEAGNLVLACDVGGRSVWVGDGDGSWRHFVATPDGGEQEVPDPSAPVTDVLRVPFRIVRADDLTITVAETA